MVDIVKAEERHVKDIGDLWWEFIIFHRDIDPIWEPEDNAVPFFIEGHLRKYLQSEDCLVLAAMDGPETVGYSLAEIKRIPPGLKRDDYGHIDQIAVAPGCRREGIGEKLYHENVRWFRSKNIKRIEVDTAARNNVANSFWQKQGFAVYTCTMFKEDPSP